MTKLTKGKKKNILSMDGFEAIIIGSSRPYNNKKRQIMVDIRGEKIVLAKIIFQLYLNYNVFREAFWLVYQELQKEKTLTVSSDILTTATEKIKGDHDPY